MKLIMWKDMQNHVERQLKVAVAAQVLHCVMFPRLEYDLPILSMDMVGKGGGSISLAVIDPCPVALNRSLPPQYVATVR